MPTPREAFVNTVERQGYSGARVRAADFGAAGEIMGRAVQGLGRDVQQVAQDIDDTQTLYATAAAKKADTSAMPQLSAILTAVKNTEGLDTVAAKEKALADLDAIEKEHMAALKNPRAQRMFQETFALRKANAIASISEYEHDQVRVAHKNESISHLNTSVDTAVDNYSNQDEFRRNLGAALLDVEAIHKGAAPGTIAAEKAKVTSLAHAKVFEKLNAEGNFLGAEKWRLDHSTEIDPDTESKLMRANAPGLFDSRIDIMWEAVSSGNVGLVETANPAPAPGRLPVNPIEGKDYNPVAGARRTGDAASHARRGSNNMGIDFAAREGSAIHPPMSGRVAEVGYNDSNGHFVKVAYDNGLTGIFLHLKTPPPVDQGAPVGPGTVIGAVGNTGKSRGAHVHYSVKNANGNYVDPDKVRYENSDPQSPQYKPEDTDTAALFNRIYTFSKANNLTGRETDALVARASAYANRNQALKQEQEARLTDAAMEQATALGENLTKPSQIPGYPNLPWQAKARIDEQIERNTQPREPESHGVAYADMRLLRHEDEAEYLKKNPFALQMTRPEQIAMAEDQAIRRKRIANGGGGAVFDARTKAKAAADLYLFRLPGVSGNINTADEKKLKIDFYDHLERRIAARVAANGGKDLGAGEYERMAAESAMAVTQDGKEIARFQVNEQGGSVRMRRLDAAKAGWRRANPGQPLPSDAWFAQQMQNR